MQSSMYAQVMFNTEGHGVIDVEFKISKYADLDTLIGNSFGVESVAGVTVIPEALAVHNMPPSETIESLVRRLELVDDIKASATEGATVEVARSMPAHATFGGTHNDPALDPADASFERDWQDFSLDRDPFSRFRDAAYSAVYGGERRGRPELAR